MTEWRNLIVGHGEEAPDQLLANPANFRVHPRHQRAAMRAIFDHIGWADEVLVNRRTGHIVNGHHRVEIAMETGQRTVPVRYVDVDEATERQLLATFDPVAALAYQDADKLAELREQTAVTNETLQALIDGRRIEVGEPATEDLAWSEADFRVDRGDDDAADGADETPERSDGSLLALVDVTIDEPRHAVSPGDVWQVGKHLLFVTDVLTGWPVWAAALQPGDIFCPYPGPFVALTKRAETARCILVQPSPYIAGHILDRYAEVHGDDAVRRSQ